jgi:hypothetical protein
VTQQTSRSSSKGPLKAGDWVRVRSGDEILRTLDDKGRFENVPFMPEMVQYCGRRFRVGKRADKTCDPAHTPWTLRRMTNTVHLEMLRCDGSGHDGCEAGCLLFWKEAWLERVDSDLLTLEDQKDTYGHQNGFGSSLSAKLLAASRATDPGGETLYTCQATELRNFSSFMKWWDPRQYWWDFQSGNLCSGEAEASRRGRLLDRALSILSIIRAAIVYVSWIRYGNRYPAISGQLKKTPVANLNLKPGELVMVRSKAEIEATLDADNRNRGLLFDTEMVPYCGGIFRVLRRVHHIVDERTGKMLHMKYPCIVLEGVYCKSDYHNLCPRAIYSYWRENWLVRVDSQPDAQALEQATAGSIE